LQRLWDEERFDRIVAPAPNGRSGGFTAKDVTWILSHAPSETIVLKPTPAEPSPPKTLFARTASRFSSPHWLNEDRKRAPRIVLTVWAGSTISMSCGPSDEVVATCHLNYERPLEIDDRIEIGGQFAIVRMTESLLGAREPPLVVQLCPIATS
jgi:hypothetical protein